MKLQMRKSLMSLVAVTPLLFSGCLKDEAFDNGEIQSVHGNGNQKVVAIALTTTSGDNHLQLAFEKSDTDTTFNAVPVTLAGNAATEDIKVTVSLNPALLGSYNADNGTTHEEAPSNLYTIINPGDSAGYVVTIPKGSNTGYLQMKVKPNDYLGFDYALGLQITGIQPAGYYISTNLGTGIVAIGVKNEWDGIYSYKGYTLRAGDPALTGNFTDKEMPLVTKGAVSVGFGDYALWGDGNSGIAIGFPVLTLNTSEGVPYPVTITSDGGAYNDPAYNSRYDPDTKTFYISYTWGSGPSSRLSTDTLTYLRPR